MGKLDGKVALITGAASGIGRATSLLFCEEGAKVVVVDCVSAGGEETVKLIREAGGDAIFIEADVSKTADVTRMIGTTVDTFGRIDILYNNAGIMGNTWIQTADIPDSQWDKIIATNLRGVFLGTKYVIPLMIKQGGGVIVNTASTAGLIGLPGLPAYCASKAGVIQLTKVSALEYAGQNIRVNCICPGGILTPMSAPVPPGEPGPEFRHPQPMGKFADPEEIAKAALYLACDDSAYVTGIALTVDGGWTTGLPKWPSRK